MIHQTGGGGGGLTALQCHPLQCYPVFEQLGPRYDLSQYKVSQDGESNNTFQHFGKTKASSGMAGHIFLYQALDQIIC